VGGLLCHRGGDYEENLLRWENKQATDTQADLILYRGVMGRCAVTAESM
jgi:hypothetical protein